MEILADPVSKSVKTLEKPDVKKSIVKP